MEAEEGYDQCWELIEEGAEAAEEVSASGWIVRETSMSLVNWFAGQAGSLAVQGDLGAGRERPKNKRK